MECIKFEYEREYIKDFIKLPKMLYTKKDNMEDPKMIKKILLDQHPLSKYFKLSKFIIYDKTGPVGRFIITEYPDDKKTCYIGFFECVNDNNVAKYLFKKAYEYVKSLGYKKLVGPVDASFWIKYRLKINKFDLRPYTGEPYNLDYYLKLFLNNRFHIKEHYTSQIYEKVDKSYNDPKFISHYKEFKKLGYDIRKPKNEEFDKCIEELYYMVTDLYSDFPIFKKVEKEDFLEVFNSYKSIINMDMVRMAYFKNKPVGFYISVPNYNNIVYHLNIKNILKIMKLRKHPTGYVMLYMGVNREHTGLGKALVYSIVEELKQSHLPSIGALARDGKINQNYAKEKITSRYEYVLLERDIK